MPHTIAQAAPPEPAAPCFPHATPADLLDAVRAVCRLRHLSIHTEDTYLKTIRPFIQFHGNRHLAKLGAAEIR